MKKRTTNGFSLVEVALALGIASFCLLTLLALMSVGIQGYHQSDNQSAMVNLATMVARDLEATPSSGTSPRFLFSIPAAGGTATSSTAPVTLYVDGSGVATGAIAAAPTSGSIYRISLFFTPPTLAGQKTATLARIWITFPANADKTPTSTPTNYTSMFQTTIALNRN